MPIRPFVNGDIFDPETARILRVALELTCIALRVGDCDDDVKQAIVNKIIALAKAGERNPDVLCELALKDIRRPDLEAAWGAKPYSGILFTLENSVAPLGAVPEKKDAKAAPSIATAKIEPSTALAFSHPSNSRGFV